MENPNDMNFDTVLTPLEMVDYLMKKNPNGKEWEDVLKYLVLYYQTRLALEYISARSIVPFWRFGKKRELLSKYHDAIESLNTDLIRFDMATFDPFRV